MVGLYVVVFGKVLSACTGWLVERPEIPNSLLILGGCVVAIHPQTSDCELRDISNTVYLTTLISHTAQWIFENLTANCMSDYEGCQIVIFM